MILYNMTEEDRIFLTVPPEEAGERLDQYLAKHPMAGLSSRSYGQKLIEEGCILVNGARSRPNYRVKAEDCLSVLVPAPEPAEILPENIPIDIIYEDQDVIVINKCRGMVVHPAAGNISGTLVNALLYHCSDLSDINGVRRPGIVHRIDKDTTGLLVAAKNNHAHICLSRQLQTHTMFRQYLAVVEGILSEPGGTVDAPVGRHPTDRKRMCVNLKNGKPAVTHYTVLERYACCSLVSCRLETGRTHQIRVHLAYIGHPVTGDPVYGYKNKRGINGQALHAQQLHFLHPADGKEMFFTAEPPADFQELMRRLGEGPL